MTALDTKAHREIALRDLATDQFGVLRYDDLTGAGLERHHIAHRLEHGRLTRLHHRVYAFGHTALRAEGRWLAAQWACGDGAVLSHATAAAFHEMAAESPGAGVHITATRQLARRAGITPHETRHLDRVDVFHAGHFAVTTIPRTLVDLADILDWSDYRAIADRQRALRLDRILEAQQRTPFRPGAPLVKRLLEADDAHTKSEFERRFLRFLKAHGLPRPDGLNLRVAGNRADCVYRTATRLVVELDGRAYHERRAQMRADRRRDTDYQLAGYRILRLVWDDLHPDEAPATAARIRALLAF